jgi:predicted NAD/FAD-dependent oxidoreductase
METEVLVVGAGTAGLACAGQLAEAGAATLVWEKSRGVGGRCATRRIEQTIVDHGLAFYHGSDPELHAALSRAGGEQVIHGWPRTVRGSGAPCQPSAFRAGDWCLSYRNGVTTFPKHLAAGLDLRLQRRATVVQPGADHWRVTDETGQVAAARDLVLAIPTPQALELLQPWLAEHENLAPLGFLLGNMGFVCTLTVIALYPTERPAPEWEMWYPEDSAILQLVSHDSSKRIRPPRTALVLQALPAWSREHWQRPVAEWSQALLDEAGRLIGAWATEPKTVQTHRWRFSRVGSGGDLAGPLLFALAGGQRLGIAGEGFAAAAGVQAAWRSGRALARRLMEKGESG